MSELKLPYDEINAFIRASSQNSVIMIGCDSIRKGGDDPYARYSTVVCIRRATGEGKDIMYHGCKVFGASVTMRDYGRVIRSGKLANLKTRLMQEVTFAMEAFEHVHEAIGDRPFEIHLDINSRPECESNVARSRGYRRPSVRDPLGHQLQARV
jgi:predicted RNase H-related nuclease YkuK (DUF458 family)